MKQDKIRQQILELVKEYHRLAFRRQKFIAGETLIHYSERVFDDKEIASAIEACLDFWLTGGRYTEEFEKKLAEYVGVKYATFVNSGSSANLLALSCLTSSELGDRRLKVGDEVITTACGFPTTLNPIIQNNLVPVFVDIDLTTYNIDYTQLEKALSDKTKAIMVAHTLGNPFMVEKVCEFAKEHNLWLVEDACDGLGGEYKDKKIGSFGDVSTFSFYPAHQITTGEGGAVLTNSPILNKAILSFRDWGRSCFCNTGKDNTCGKRFTQQFGELPFGYDHKYVYTNIGYNLKATDIQAAIGVAQMEKLDKFVAKRIYNYEYIYHGLCGLGKYFSFMEGYLFAKRCYFGFPLLVKTKKFTRNEIVQYLEEHKIQTRLMFGGNLLKQPAYKDIKYRQIGNLENTDNVMNNLFWIGVYPALTKKMLDYMIKTIREFVGDRR